MPTPIQLPGLLAGALVLALAASVNAHGDHDHGSEKQDSPGAHAHGVASLELAADGADVELVFTIAGVDAVGFEHGPGNAAEREAVASEASYLRSNALIEPIGGECSLQDSHVDSDLMEGGQDSGHAEFEVIQRLHCPPGLSSGEIRVTALERYSGLERLRLIWVLDGAQGAKELTPGRRRVRLR